VKKNSDPSPFSTDSNVTFNKIEFDQTLDYGKKPSLFRQNLRPQYLVLKVKLTEIQIFTKFLPK
jgi:hypothetical protein